MENRSNNTHLCSVIWNFLERNEEGSTATCNECKKKGKETMWPRNHPCQNGLSFPVSNIRRHLRGVHKIQLDEVQYDDSNPGFNKRIGYIQNKYNCPFCGMNFESNNIKFHWSGANRFTECRERGRYFSNGYSVGFHEDSDLKSVNKFNAFVDVSKQLSLANYQVYAWYLMPINAAEWVSVFYIGMTKNSKRRIEESINREFPKRYAGRKVSRLVIKDGLTKSAALTLEASLQSCFDPEKIPLCVRFDFDALQVNGLDYMDLRNAAIAFFRMAVASESYTQHVVANALPNETPKSSRKRSSITDEENTPRTPDTPSTSLKKFSFEDTQMKITKKNLRPGFDPVAVPNVPSSQPY